MKTIVIAALTLTAALAGSAANAAGGCGAGWFRGPYGHCHPDSQRVIVAPAPVVTVAPTVAPGAEVIYAPMGRACPLGWHLGPQGRRCWPN